MTVKDFVFETFLRLTSKTCPHGFEDELVKDVMSNILPENIEKDQHGNYFYEVGSGSRTIFASHIDTVSKEYLSVTHILDDDGMIRTDGKTTLGADDKAGMTVMLWMIKNNIPGLYYFFIGEEVGCIGSGLAAKYGDFKGKYDRIISFDRRGTNSIITFQSTGRSCSDEFADDLCSELNKSGMSYEKDDGGVYTDSAEFMDIIPECTNVSVGYYKEHTVNEHQDIEHLSFLADACTSVDWENLTTKRDPSVVEHKSYDYYWGGSDDWEWNGYDYVKKSNKRKRTRRGKNRNRRTYYDNGSELIDITSNNNWSIPKDQDKYSWIMHKFADDKLTWGELQTIKDCYLDMNSDYDTFFYEFLKEQIVDF
jgi:hypothetical protein